MKNSELPHVTFTCKERLRIRPTFFLHASCCCCLLYYTSFHRFSASSCRNDEHVKQATHITYDNGKRKWRSMVEVEREGSWKEVRWKEVKAG